MILNRTQDRTHHSKKYQLIIQKSVSFLAADISFFQVQKTDLSSDDRSAIATTTKLTLNI